MYPNPTKGKIHLSTTGAVHKEVYSVLGEKLLETALETVDISNLPQAIYILKLTNSETGVSKTYKIVKH